MKTDRTLAGLVTVLVVSLADALNSAAKRERGRRIRQQLAYFLIVITIFTSTTKADDLTFRVQDRTLNRIAPQIFGQFLERASFGEPGPEPFADLKTGRLPVNVIEKLKAMHIPVIRFPGGGDVDRIDWTDMIDNVPGRNGGRPISKVGSNTITNRFGYDEYFGLRDELKCETIIVLNLLDVLAKRVPLDQAVNHAAGLVAYCNAPVGAKLPDGMADWPSIRAKNGRTKPFRAEYFQIGNEWQWPPYPSEVREKLGLNDKDALAKWYIEVLHAMIRAIRAIDPNVKLIIDGKMDNGIENIVLKDAGIRAAAPYVTFHIYAPGPADQVWTDGRPVDGTTLNTTDWWYALASIPGELSGGINIGLGKQIKFARELGYRVVCTEWNWNGWAFKDAPPQFTSELLPTAMGLGTAGFIHGLMRQGDAITLATQSMLLGHRWDITAVHADPEGKVPPYYLPQGLVTMFYNLHHGDRLLAVENDPLPGKINSHIVGGWTAKPETTQTVAYIDLLVTADTANVYIHAINRHMDDAQTITVDLTSLQLTNNHATHYRYTTRTAAERERDGTPQACHVVKEDAEVRSGLLRAKLTARSINIIEIAK